MPNCHSLAGEPHSPLLFLHVTISLPGLAHPQVYAEVKQQVAGGIDYLLRKRETDPYADFVRRMAYENAAVPFGGKRRQAPTFNP